jgi:hypothetical protein
MHLEPDLVIVYLDRAFDQMAAVLDRVGDDQLDVEPPGPDTTALGALVLHCVGVSEFWLGHVALGRATVRNREAEFTASATRAELQAAIAAARVQAADDVRALGAGQGTPSEWRAAAPGGGGDDDDDAVVLHVIEELYQHVGHMDLTADALIGDQPPA